MMRIAIAGSGGLAAHLAYHLNESVHPLIILSRAPKPHLEQLDYQVVVVNYDSQDELRFALRGIDIVISTVSGTPQINLIDAAAHARVRRFVPAEFEGRPERRPSSQHSGGGGGSSSDDALDLGRGRAAALERLRHYARPSSRHRMRFTVFVCGVFYERFARGGLAAAGIALGSGIEFPGAFLVDVEANTAEVVERNRRGGEVMLCMTAVNDVALFVAAALEGRELDAWPEEFKMRGDRRSVAEVVQYIELAQGAQPGSLINTLIYSHEDLEAHLANAFHFQEYARAMRIQGLIAAANRRYDFSTNLNALVDFRPQPFWDWLRTQFAPTQLSQPPAPALAPPGI